MRTKKLKLTKEEVIEQFKKVHGDKFDYSKFEYNGNLEKSEIICNIHGSFYQHPKSHKRGRGCPLCNKHRKRTEEDAIKEFREVHGNKYDYSDLNYKNGSSKVKIKCPYHGWFYQIASEHKWGYGCRRCADDEKIIPLDEWKKKCHIIHDNKYDYSQVSYKILNETVIINCPIHGEYKQNAYSHKQGYGCPDCGNNRKSLIFKEKYPADLYRKKVEKIHGTKYDYSKTEYINNHTKVKIRCPKHGVFERFPQNVLKAEIACEECRLELNKENTYNKIVSYFECNEWNDLVLDKKTFKGLGEIGYFNCNKHGKFERIVDHNLFAIKHPCVKCRSKFSNLENIIKQFLDKNKIVYDVHKRFKTSNGKNFEIDFYFKDIKKGLEINGLRFHGENIGKDNQYHLNKINECDKFGIELFHIYENEIIPNEHLALDKISKFLELNCLEKIRGGEIIDISEDIAKIFLNDNHPLGFKKSKNYKGFYLNDNLYSCFCLNESKIIRYADKNYIFVEDDIDLLISSIREDSVKITMTMSRDWDFYKKFINFGFKINDLIEPKNWYFLNGKHGEIYSSEEKLEGKIDRFWDSGGFNIEYSI